MIVKPVAMATPGRVAGSSAGARRGFFSGLLAIALLGVAALPGRLAVAALAYGDVSTRLERLVAGVLVDLAAVAFLLPIPVLATALLIPLLARTRVGARWQQVGPLIASVVPGFLLWLGTVVAFEVKRERGGFPTWFDLAEGGTNASFVAGAVDFIHYLRIWAPALVGLVLASVVVTWWWRHTPAQRGPWSAWAMGVAAGLMLGAGGIVAVQFGLSRINRFSGAAVGDPLTGLVESAVDVVRNKGPSTPRQLVLDAELPADLRAAGAARLGWPSESTAPGCESHPFARPLDVEREKKAVEPRGRQLLEALEAASAQLFSSGDEAVAVFVLSLEGFRADDIAALNPAAPVGIAPFVSGLYQSARAKSGGVLAAPALYQAGVRTAQGLGAMTCGIGTLPYNLSFIRDLEPLRLRCLPDVLADAGFAGSFFYGSDLKFDGMDSFLKEHHFQTRVSQLDFPPEAPKGTWDGVTDFAVFDEAVKRVEAGVKAGTPQLSMVMSLSHHSPFTAPADLPVEVTQRVTTALTEKPNRADADDTRRLVAFSYTDAAVERLLRALEERGLSERSVVLLAADHSTGHAYLWGEQSTETDAQKAQIPLAIVVPEAFRQRVKDRAALEASLSRAQTLLEQGPLSQNDVPSMLLALLHAHPGVAKLPRGARWHTLGGQVTSPYFQPGGPADSYVLGINGVSELYALDRQGNRTGDYEDSVFLKTRADRYRVTPRLIPVAAMLAELMQRDAACVSATKE